MNAYFPVVLDACVIAHYTLCDLLLRLAEDYPPIFSPKWSDKILQEVHSVQTRKLKRSWTDEDSHTMRRAMEAAFPEAMVNNLEALEDSLPINPKDRHVLATAITAHAAIICTYNLKDFPPRDLAPFGVKAMHPGDFLISLYSISPALVVARLSEMADKRKTEIPALLKKLAKQVPSFSAHVADTLGWSPLV